MADIVGALTMKGLALPHLVDKDSYDIYAMSGFYGGNPADASERFLSHAKKQDRQLKKRA